MIGQNACLDLNVQHEQIISPLQRKNEWRHIVCSIDASNQVSVHLVKWFHRRRFF